MISLTSNDLQWLESRGGRTAEDVELDEENHLYVWMGDGRGKYHKVFLP